MSNGKVLVIDDDPLVTATFQAELTAADFAVKVANSGSAGFAVLQTFKPNLILLDLNMPVTSGLELLALIRGIPEFAQLPVMILTASAPDSPQVAAALDAGVTGVMQKAQWDADAVVTAVSWAMQKGGFSILQEELP